MSEEIYYVQKEGWVGNCLTWWRKGGRGYTTDVADAHEFTKEEAESIIGNPNSDKKMHKKSDVDACVEMHVSCENAAWHAYRNGTS